MVITTRRPACRGRHWALLLLLPVPALQAADWTVLPSLRLREAYSDNIRLAPAGQASSEFTTEIAPSLALRANGARLRLTLDYALQKIMYTRSPDRLNHQLSGGGHAELLPDWLFLDGQANISQQNISPFGSQQSDSSQFSANAATVRAYRFSPYLLHDFRGLASAELRYDYQNSSSGRLLRVRSDQLKLKLVGDNGGRGWNWDVVADRKNTDDASLPPVTRSNVALSLRWPVLPRLSMFATAGHESADYHALGAQPEGPYWSAGAGWQPSPRTSISASLGRRYFGNTYSVDAQYRMHNTFCSLSYNEDITTGHDQFLAMPPAALGNFLYQLWAGRIPNSQQRIDTINAFLRFAHLQGENGKVNYFSHRYFLEKQWNLSTIYAGPKSTLALGLATSGRTAQTSSGIDSVLLGQDDIALEDRIRQSSAHAGWNWRLSPRSSVNLNASYALAHSLSTGRRDNNTVLVAGLDHQFQPKLSGTVDLRHSRHHSNHGGNYRENGISATLSLQF